MRRGIQAVLPLVTSLALGSVASAGVNDRPRYKRGEAIVVFREARERVAMRSAVAGLGPRVSVARTLAAVRRPEVALVRFSESDDVEAMVGLLRNMPEVALAEPNYLAYIPEYGSAPSQGKPPALRAVVGKDGRATVDPEEMIDPHMAAMTDPIRAQFYSQNNDAYSGSQNGWYHMGGNVIWPDTAVNPTVAVIDTGVDYTHPDLVGRVIKGKDWVNGDADPMDDNGHGTHCAGNVGALVNNLKGIAGMSKAKILAVKVLGVEGSGTYFDIAAGITDAANNLAVKVLSLSLGGYGTSAVLTTAVQTAVANGKLIVVAAGNDNITTAPYPAAYADSIAYPTLAPQVMAVAASGVQHYYSATNWYWDYGCKSTYSNYGTWVTVVAPGTSIYSTTPVKEFYQNTHFYTPKQYAYMSGTSMATPQVAGTASRVWSTTPTATAAQIRAQILATGLDTVLNNQGVFISTDGTLSDDYLCWPAAMNTSAFDVNVAAAMGRASLYGSVRNANGNVPLTGAKVTAYQGTAIKGYGGVVDSPYADGGFVILNVPMAPSSPYTLGVGATGYTTGIQKYKQTTVQDCGGGHDTYNCNYQTAGVVTVPKNVPGVWNIVTDWQSPWYDIDQYLFTPSSAPIACAVGGHAGLFATGNDCGFGSLVQAPFARLLNNGGYYTSGYSYYATSTWTAVKSPLYSTASGTPYEIFLTDHTPAVNMNGSWMHGGGGVTTRLWSAGAIKATMLPATINTTVSCTIGTDCDGFWVGNLTGTGTFIPVGLYGKMDSATGILPYGTPVNFHASAARASPRKHPADGKP